jgi:hypothetical protein
MRLDQFSGSIGLSGNKIRDLGYVFFFDDGELRRRSLLRQWPLYRHWRRHCAAAS